MNTTKAFRFMVGLVVVLTAWTVGNLHGQAQLPEFEIRISAPQGQTQLICTKGCDWDQNPTSFSCSNSASGRCGAAYNQHGFTRTSN